MSSRPYICIPPIPMASICFIMRCMSISFLSTGSKGGPFWRSFLSAGAFFRQAPSADSSVFWHSQSPNPALFMSGDVNSNSAMSVSRSLTISSQARCMVLHSVPHLPKTSAPMCFSRSSEPFSTRSIFTSHSPTSSLGSHTFSTFSRTIASVSLPALMSRRADASLDNAVAIVSHTWHLMYFTSDFTARAGPFFVAAPLPSSPEPLASAKQTNAANTNATASATVGRGTRLGIVVRWGTRRAKAL
mmetsp:Transcript_8339/g.31182  ORF Transcript_8339/g.31182 Transcript_8339/m.31182 type:complete len:245 (-) Transcript_8339:33-767(-)